MTTPRQEYAYGSWMEYRTALAALDPSWNAAGPDADDGWAAGLNTVGAAIAFSDAGWPDGLARVRAIAAPALRSATLATHKRGEPVADVTGACLDVGAYLSGVPECWVTRRRRKVAPAITLAVNLSTSGGIPSEILINRGAAVLALVQSLQASGYVVRVNAISGGQFHTPAGDREVWTRVCLTDDGGGPLDMDRLAYALAHPSAPRTLMYTLEGAHAGVPADRLKSGIGWIGWPDGGRDAPPPAGWEGDLYLPGVYISDANWRDAASVERWVEATYQKLTRGEGAPAVET